MTPRLVRNFVGGEFIEGERRCWDKISPVDGTVAARVHEADAALVDRAVRAGRAALHGGWAATPVGARAALLRRAADRIEPTNVCVQL